MLTFKKGGYNKESLKILRDYLLDDVATMMRNPACMDMPYNGCQACPYRVPCGDLMKVVRYLDDLIH